MNLKITNHAKIRIKQRGIPRIAVSVLMEHGICRKVPGDACQYYLDKRAMDQWIHEMKREIEDVERLKSARLIVANDGSIITVFREA